MREGGVDLSECVSATKVVGPPVSKCKDVTVMQGVHHVGLYSTLC